MTRPTEVNHLDIIHSHVTAETNVHIELSSYLLNSAIQF